MVYVDRRGGFRDRFCYPDSKRRPATLSDPITHDR